MRRHLHRRQRSLWPPTPSTTVAGATFIAPAGWSVAVKRPATIIEAPEGDSRIALVDVKAADADAAGPPPGLPTVRTRSGR